MTGYPTQSYQSYVLQNTNVPAAQPSTASTSNSQQQPSQPMSTTANATFIQYQGYSTVNVSKMSQQTNAPPQQQYSFVNIHNPSQAGSSQTEFARSNNTHSAQGPMPNGSTPVGPSAGQENPLHAIGQYVYAMLKVCPLFFRVSRRRMYSHLDILLPGSGA